MGLHINSVVPLMVSLPNHCLLESGKQNPRSKPASCQNSMRTTKFNAYSRSTRDVRGGGVVCIAANQGALLAAQC